MSAKERTAVPPRLIEAAAEKLHDLYGGKIGYCYHNAGYRRCAVDAPRLIAAILAALPECVEVIDAVGHAVWESNWGDAEFPTEPGSDRYFVDVTTEDVLVAISQVATPAQGDGAA